MPAPAGAGVNFEVVGHNFRNNYEVAVDSFGTMWQSDNDDDGNRGVRINYVMEYGNFGYVDELTGAGWQAKRTNMEKEIPLRHWHQNDPGVVPNLLNTGAGSPTGITVYEGNLLPTPFRRAEPRKGPVDATPQTVLIHCDAGPSVVRAYLTDPDGAGYKVAKTVNILDGSKKNQWFRPVDPRRPRWLSLRQRLVRPRRRRPSTARHQPRPHLPRRPARRQIRRAEAQFRHHRRQHRSAQKPELGDALYCVDQSA